MGHSWNAKIETKTTTTSSKNSKEKRQFLIKIHGINEVTDAPFKIKTHRNDELFSSEVSDFLQNLYSNTFGNGHLEKYWQCAYHGRNKRISLYVIGCEKFSGLLILDENLYSLMPIEVPDKSSLIYRLDLLQETTKFNTTSVMEPDNSFLNNYNQKRQSPEKILPQSIDSPIMVNLNLDKEYFSENLLKNSQQLNIYFNNMIIQTHLTWSYFFHEHFIYLKFNQVNFVDLKRITRKSSLFNIDLENIGNTPVNTLHNLYTNLYKKLSNNNDLNVYLIPQNILTENETLNGLASQATKPPRECNKPETKSLILLSEKHYNSLTVPLKKPEPSRYLIYAIQQSNILIDLIGMNLGNTIQQHIKNNCPHFAADEYSWHFQVPARSYNPHLSLTEGFDPKEFDQEQDNIESTFIHDACLNRVITTEQDCLKISLTRSICGNGVIEADEQCDCDLGDFKCMKCCDTRTCKFRKPNMKCSIGECCDDECQIKPKNTICRGSNNTVSADETSCDWPEYCDGTLSSCPADQFAHNGLSCSKVSSAHCWNGRCVSGDKQCQRIWSQDSRSSDPSCYENFNVIGFQNGNCGQNRTGFIACDRENAQCGLLNCQLGSDKPSISSESFFKATTNTRGIINECKVITSKPSVYVSDGTQCVASGHKTGLCVSQKCVPLDSVLNIKSNKCSETGREILCSNNGICDNMQTCRCLPNWTGSYCENFIQSESSMMATKNIILTRDEDMNGIATKLNEKYQFKTSQIGPVTLLSAIGGAFSLLIIMLIILFLVYRRRNGRERKVVKKSISKNHFNPIDTIDSLPTRLSNSALYTSELSVHQASTFKASSSSSSLNQSQCSNQNISLTKVSHAIKQLKAKPSKSILKKNFTVKDEPSLVQDSKPIVKKLNRTAYSKNASEMDSSINDSAIKFERQVHKNTLLNSAIGVGHRISRRSMTHAERGMRNHDLNESLESNSSVESDNRQLNSSENSISSNLSNSNAKQDRILNRNESQNKKKVPDLSFLTDSSSGSSNASSRRNSSSSSISLQLLEPSAIGKPIKEIRIDPNEEQKTDFYKVQDYLNELNILSQQNTFRIESEKNNQASIVNKLTTSTFKSKEKPVLVTPQRPETLLTPIRKSESVVNHSFPEPHRLSQILTTSPNTATSTGYNAGQQMLLHLQILKNQNPDDLLNLYTSTSETSSGYLSNSTQNINVESGKSGHNKRSQHPNSSYNSSTCSSSVTPPMPTCMTETSKDLTCCEKRFSYMTATGSSNNLNINC